MTASASSAFSSALPDRAGEQPGDPSLEWRVGGGVLIGLLLVAGIWAGFARLDSAVSAQGVVKVAGDQLAIQSLEGGVVSALPVVEGEKVAKGQLLLRFAGSSAMAQERSLAARVIGLQAQLARLDAESTGADHVATPPALSGLTGPDRIEADRAMALARTELLANGSNVHNQAALLRQRVQQIDDQIRGHAERKAAGARQIALSNRELDGVQILAAKGYASQMRVLALQRAVASLEGDLGSEQAEIARLRSSAGEARLQLLQLTGERTGRRAEEARLAQTELQTLLPQWHAAQDALQRTELRAPVAGTVMGLSIRAAGAVAGPGQRLMAIVPTDRSLVVDAQIGTGDANDLVRGMAVNIRVTGLHGRNNPVLRGRLTRLSADSFIDDKTGHAFYAASFSVPQTELRRLERAAGLSAAVRPGTPVQVVLPLHARTALQYWFEPLVQALSGSLHER